MFGGIAFARVFALCDETETSNVFDEEKREKSIEYFARGVSSISSRER